MANADTGKSWLEQWDKLVREAQTTFVCLHYVTFTTFEFKTIRNRPNVVLVAITQHTVINISAWKTFLRYTW